jgi:16S rRNA (cytosine967-C5)-methyltransferase
MSSVRTVALDALLRVALDAAYLDRALPSLLDKARLGPEDRALATELSYGVLRRQMWLDALIAPHSNRPLKEIDVPTLMALRLGAYQIHALDRIPPHAAVSETVQAIKEHQQSSASFVNAVLRKLSTQPKAKTCFDDPAASVEALAKDASVPPWILKAFASAMTRKELTAPRFGKKGSASIATIAQALAKPAQPTLRVLSRRMKRDALLELLAGEGASAEATEHSPYGVRVSRIGDPSLLPGFGHAFIAQDEAAQWAAMMAEGEKGPVLDACAAPGGKALALYDAGLEPMTALEAQPKRVSLLERTLEKANVPCEVLLEDASRPPRMGPFKTIFVDAPCTGSGTLIRHPELRWKLDKPSIARLAVVQFEILAGLAPLVDSGGALIYAVCSVFHEEGPDQVERFLETHPEFTLETWLETLSHHDRMDGFFAARMRRRH